MAYVKIVLVGHDPIIAYENEQKASDKHPDFKADGVVVWLNKGDGKNGGNANRRIGAPQRRQRFADDEYEDSSLREPAFAA